MWKVPCERWLFECRKFNVELYYGWSWLLTVSKVSSAIWHLSLFRDTLLILQISNTFFTVRIWNCVSSPQITVSSIEDSKFSIPSNMFLIIHW